MSRQSGSGGFARTATRSINRAEVIDHNFIAFVKGWPEQGPHADLNAPLHADSPLTGQDFLELFESQMLSRHQDLEARAMRARNEGFYTIGSSGHEGNAAVGRVTRHTDIAFLHYRSGAFMQERARKLGIDMVYDTALSLAASSEDPISRGRHKVWGSKRLWVPPQTSTIASHLPKAAGCDFGIGRSKRQGIANDVATDSIVLCSFGDASANHCTALSGFNAARYVKRRGSP